MKETLSARFHQRGLRRVEKKMERLRVKMEVLKAKKEAHRLTPAQYTKKKSNLDNRMRQLSARERTLRGALVHERERAQRMYGSAAR